MSSIIQQKRIKLEEKSRLNFRIHKSKLLKDKKIIGYLKKSQKICEQLDSNKVKFNNIKYSLIILF